MHRSPRPLRITLPLRIRMLPVSLCNASSTMWGNSPVIPKVVPNRRNFGDGDIARLLSRLAGSSIAKTRIAFTFCT